MGARGAMGANGAVRPVLRVHIVRSAIGCTVRTCTSRTRRTYRTYRTLLEDRHGDFNGGAAIAQRVGGLQDLRSPGVLEHGRDARQNGARLRR